MARERPHAGEARVRALQRCLADAALGPDATLLEEDPPALAGRWGLPGADRAAFLRWRDRLLAYRDFVRSDLLEPVERMLPVTRALLASEGAWEDAASAFLEARCVDSPYYRDVAPAFVAWLAASGWGAERWPGLLELAHFEVLQTLLEHQETPGPPGNLLPAPGPGLRLVPAPASQVVAYAHRVHLATEEAPLPGPGPTHLLACRTREGDVAWRELTPAAAALLVRARTEPLDRVVAALGLDPAAALDLLDEVRALGGILGWAPSEGEGGP